MSNSSSVSSSDDGITSSTGLESGVISTSPLSPTKIISSSNNNNSSNVVKQDEDSGSESMTIKPTTTTTTTTSTSKPTTSTSIFTSSPTTTITNTLLSSSTSGNNNKDQGGNLFINFLPAHFNNASLRAMFSSFGEIDSCRVMVDLNSGQSRGFGFVKFKDIASAQYAINSMNGARIDNKTLLVRFANSDPTTTPSGIKNDTTFNNNITTTTTTTPLMEEETKASNNVFIKGLPLTFSLEDLNSLFSPYGTVLESKLLLDIATNASRGQALVRFEQVDSATKSVKALNGYIFQDPDKPLIVKYAENEEEKKLKRLKQQQKQVAMIPSGSSSASVANIQRQQQFRFSPYPSPTTSPINHPLYQTYYQNVPNLPTIHSPLLTSIPPTTNTTIAGGSGGPNDRTNLYVFNLPPEADDALLYRLFSPCGAIASVKIIRDPVTNVCKGYGFVRMVTLTDSYTAITNINGLSVNGKIIQVTFKK